MIEVAIALVNILLSPFGLILFFICFSGPSYFTPDSTNTSKLKIQPYVIYSMVYTTAVLGISYGIGYLLLADFDVWQAYQPKYWWLSAIGWAVTLFTLRTYFRGMEGNIMGFIFFPMIAVTSLALIAVNVSSLFSLSADVSAPTVDARYFWLGFVGHAFMPIQLLLFSQETLKNGKAISQTVLEQRIVPLLGVLIFQMLLFGLHWTAVKLFGERLTFAQFFGEGESLLYFVPMLGGGLYFLMSTLVAKENRNDSKLWSIVIFLTLSFGVLQLFNYIRMLKEWF
ncbi:hypothetical protein [Reichenbachiella agariperforans]|uniref:hypothetical protein n=1 Tax=Reichenbachiella agariperforans TaxID=156994 RepID=UPI001C0885D1|nr:hypothetical protein [Reichenbachiella agariperforans]MBU2915719.1 hypothetical protein [Reichenbachiella agariperforans]